MPVFLDRLARLHAAFWNDPRLPDPRLGLCDPAQLLDQSSLPMAQKHTNLSMGVIPEWVRGGWEVMEELLDPDIFMHLKSLIEDPQPLFEALSRYPYTLLHGDYRAENLAHPDRPVAFDWQEATRSLMTIDLAWFAKQGFVQEAMGQAQAIGFYRNDLEQYLNRRFDDASGKPWLIWDTSWMPCVRLAFQPIGINIPTIQMIDLVWRGSDSPQPAGARRAALDNELNGEGKMLTEKRFDTGTLTINYAEGPMNGSPLVLLHGGTARWQELNPLITELEHHWHVYACDKRGHGKSDRAASYRVWTFSRIR